MFNLSDKELDRLSRKAADAYEVENNSSSWEALEQRLDKELGNVPKPSVPSPRSFTFPFAYTSLIILLVGSSYFLLKSGKNSNEANKKNYSINSKQQSTNSNSSKETPAIAADEKNKIAVAPDANAAANDKKITEENKLPEEKTSSALTKETKEEKHVSIDSKKNISSQKNIEGKSENEVSSAREKNNSHTDKLLIAKNYAANNKPINDFSSRNKRTINDKLSSQKNNNSDISDNSNEKAASDKSSKNHPTNSEKIFDNNNAAIKQTEENNLEYASTSQAKQSVKHSSIVINDSSLRAETAKISAQHIIDLNKANNKSLNTNRSLQIGVSFAPDFSEVKHAYDNTRLGGGIGITLGYYLLNRLSVNTGLIFEHKYYQVDDKDFHMPQNFILNGAHVDFVNGSCKMLEIPLNLRYDFSIEGNTIFFVNGGLSSYLMQKQDYSYYCHNNIGYSSFRINQSFNAPQNFWFSTVNLSAGFETSVSNAFSIQIDPYIKIPLKGVGVGNVQLNSYGINAAIKFSPALKKSRR